MPFLDDFFRSIFLENEMGKYKRTTQWHLEQEINHPMKKPNMRIRLDDFHYRQRVWRRRKKYKFLR